jgi:peptide/nickel transport system substrate-binding protein
LKKLIIPLAFLIICSLILLGCGGGITTTPPKTTVSAPTQTTAAPTQVQTTGAPPVATIPAVSLPTTPPPGPPPVSGGILRIVAATGPQVLSYVAEMGPGDHSAVFPAAENLTEVIPTRAGTGVEPWLCEKVVDDPKNLKITWFLRKGIKFHDGTEMTADVVKWNFQMIIDGKALPHLDFLKDMQVVDNYTLVMNLNTWSNQVMPDWGYWPVITSKAAYDKASGGDPVKGKEWQRANIVGTGPFILKEYKRDDHITWVKNPNYWIPGKPYLDGIEVKIIPDPVTARATLESKQGDIWAAPAQMVADLENKGFKRQQSWPALPFGLWINTANAKSKWQDKRMREALDFAIDKAAVAKAIGRGLYTPLKALPWQGEWGYDPNYDPRPYNPAKAKSLLADAGYPNGLKIKLLAMNDPVTQDIVTALKQYLDASGFQCDLDIADPGRFFGTVYWAPPGPDQDLNWWLAGGMDTNYLQTYMRWFSTTPFTDCSYLGHTPEQIEMDKQASLAIDPKDQEVWIGKIMKYLMDNALIIPVYLTPAYVMQQPWVHSTQYTCGFTRWDTQDVWMDKH